MSFCLPKFAADAFKAKLVDGTISPEKLIDMTSADRRDLFSDIVGPENARKLNAQFESKLLLKNQQDAIIKWAKEALDGKPAIQRDVLSKVQRMTEVFQPAEKTRFLEDLASQTVGAHVTIEESGKIVNLANNVETARADLQTDPFNKEKQIAYGEHSLNFSDYVGSLKPSNNSVVVGVMNIPRTLTTVGDWGWTFRQGWGMMSRPELWQGLFKSFGYTFKDKSFQKLRAEVTGDPDYPLLKDSLRLPALTEKLSGKEEEFMNQFTGKVPVLKQIERGQQGLATFVRFSVAKKMLRDARAAGEDVKRGSSVVTDIINSVNNFSGSGNLGTGDRYANTAPVLNATLFSARKISATVNMMDPRNYFDPRISPTARSANLRNLIGSTGMTLSALYIANLFGAKVSLNPTSSDFLNVHFGKFHVDLTGGNKTYAVLLARLIENKSTSSTGKTVKFGVGYKPETRGSTLQNFGRNKLAPLAGAVADWLLGPVPSHDSSAAQAIFGKAQKGYPFDLKREALGASVPMVIDLVIQGVKEDPSNAFLGSLLDYFGNSAQVY